MYGQEFKQERLARQITQERLAKETGLNQQKISWIESDEGIPSLYDAKRIADYYGISINELIGFTDYSEQRENNSLSALPMSTLSFAKEYADIIPDKNFTDMAKLYKEISPNLRALVLGYIVGLLQNNNVNTKKILGY